MFFLFFVLWVLLSGKITLDVCVSGAAVSALLYYFCVRILGYRWTGLFGLRHFGRILCYLWYLLIEILKAGFVVMRLVYTRDREMEPVLVHFRTRLKSDTARAALANSITLTAGTITVTAEGDDFCVHALDNCLTDGIENSEFERRLLELEGAHGGY